MNDHQIDISDFAADDIQASLKVDFSRSVRLERAGSTCDAYECVIQRRRVFVKRLKPEFRGNPLYLAAFDKEYDLGVRLNHPSLPHYVAMGEDYLVMDYVEGDTLGELIRRGDERLKDKRFVNRLLGELIDVVEYLHRNQVVHCDIKPDNIIVSPYDNQPLTLVDFDKAYSAWLSDTAGNPAKYDCETCSDGQVDFKGICAVAALLGNKHLAALKDDKNLTSDALRQALGGRLMRRYIIAALILIALIFCVAFAYYLRRTADLQPVQDEIAAEETVEPVLDDEIPGATPEVEPVVVEKTFIANDDKSDTCNTTKINYLIDHNLDEVVEIIHRNIDPFTQEGKDLITKAANNALPLPQVEEADAAYCNKYLEIIDKTEKELQKRYDFHYQQEGAMLFLRSGLYESFYSDYNHYRLEIGGIIQERKGVK